MNNPTQKTEDCNHRETGCNCNLEEPISTETENKFYEKLYSKTEDWKERFEKLFNHVLGFRMFDEKELEKFIEQELKLAREEGAKDMYDKSQEMIALLKEFRQDNQEVKDMLFKAKIIHSKPEDEIRFNEGFNAGLQKAIEVLPEYKDPWASSATGDPDNYRLGLNRCRQQAIENIKKEMK